MPVSSDHAIESDGELAPVTILLIDDDEHWAWATEQLLEHEDAFSVERAHSLTAGRERFAELDPDCIVCDYDLGSETGLSLLETVRDVDPDRPFVLVTGNGNEEVASSAIGQGITGYIRKGQDNEDELLVSRVRNLVRAHRTERALDRQRRTKTAVLDVLRETASEAELCREFCQRLADDETYALTWIGTTTDTKDPFPPASAGRDEYLDAIVSHNELPAREPARVAYDRGEAVAATISPADGSDVWEAAAADYGFRSVIGVPIRYDGVTFGVLAVYLEQSHPDESHRQTLTEYAESVGYALRSFDRKRSLLSTQPVQLEITVSDSKAPLVSVSDHSAPNGRITSPSVVTRSDGTTVYLAHVPGSSRSAIETAVREHTDGTLLDIAEREDGHKCSIAVSETTPEGVVVDQGARFERTVVEDGVATISAFVREGKAVSQIATAVERQFDGAAVSTVWTERRSTETPDDPFVDLTDKQRDVVRHAFHEGYFERPRGATATEIAERLGIARQTFAQHLRAAQRTVFDTWQSGATDGHESPHRR